MAEQIQEAVSSAFKELDHLSNSSVVDWVCEKIDYLEGMEEIPDFALNFDSQGSIAIFGQETSSGDTNVYLGKKVRDLVYNLRLIAQKPKGKPLGAIRMSSVISMYLNEEGKLVYNGY